MLGCLISSVELHGSYQKSQPHTSLARPPDKLPTLALEFLGSVLSILVMPFSAMESQPTPSYECLSWGPQKPRRTPEIKCMRLWVYACEFPHSGGGNPFPYLAQHRSMLGGVQAGPRGQESTSVCVQSHVRITQSPAFLPAWFP